MKGGLFMAIQDDFSRLEVFATGPFEGLCTPAEFADEFGVDESAIRHAIRNGKFVIGKECFKFGKQWILNKYAFDKYARNGGYSEYSKIKCAYYKMLRERQEE